MLEFLKEELNHTTTENGAVTLCTTGSDCLDLFASIGALRQASEADITLRFLRAYSENPDRAMKLLFYARDIRGGLGERRVFRVILQWLAKHETQSVLKNLPYVAEFGRYDDLLCLFCTPCEQAALELIAAQLRQDLADMGKGLPVSLLGKWLPSVNASNAQTVRQAKKLARHLGMTDAAYRKTLSALRAKIRILENNLRQRDYSFDYEKQPSRALHKYRAAFLRNDNERYLGFLNRVNNGQAVLHADNLSLYELITPYLHAGDWLHGSGLVSLNKEQKQILNTEWAALPDFGGDENMLAVVDTSGSMYCTNHPMPAAVALSLGLYFAERNRGAFHNCFMEFSDRPRLIELKGATFADRLRYAASFNTVANTDLEAVFDVVLNTALHHHLRQDELPAKLVILSDMEFDCCVENADLTNFEAAKKKFADHGYRLPGIVFWNVASRNRQQPVSRNEQGVTLVSGATPRLFSMVAGDHLSPYTFMLEVLGSERYEKITA